MNDMLSIKRLLSTLEKKQLLSFQQVRDLYARRVELVEQHERHLKKPGTGSTDVDDSFTLIDTIVALNLKRKDDPLKALDEDTIYKTLAESWGVPFVKIDPLKLDLNLVTTTIPISFAKNHLVLPIEIRQGELIVATPESIQS